MDESHDINGPSALFRRELCPGSGRMEAQIPDTPTEASAHGTKLHDIIAGCIRDRVAPTVDDCEDPEDLDALRQCYRIAEEYLFMANEWGGTVLIEHKLDLEDVGIAKGGTLDFAVVYPDGRFVLVDWKFGVGWVAAPFYNRQMQAYALGLRTEFGATHGKAIIVQPFASTDVREAEFDTPTLANLEAKLRYIVERAKDPEAPLIVGPQCNGCRAASTCPARRVLAEATIAAKPSAVADTIAALPPEVRHEYFERLRLAKSFLEGALRDVEGKILDGSLSIPGFKVGAGKKTRTWVGDAEVADLLVKELGPAAYHSKLVSPAQAETLFGKGGLPPKLKALVCSNNGSPRVMRDASAGLVGE